MPGPYIHISSMKHTAEAFAGARRPFVPLRSPRIDPAWVGPDTKDLGKIMQDHANFASLGAIGPDLFFFLPDFRDEGGVSVSSVLIKVLEFLEDLYEAVDPFVSKWEHYLGPVSESMGEEISRLTGGLSETVGDITGELSGILVTALEDLITQQHDWWAFFSLGLNKGYDEQAFFWSDMLHYRETGQFARAIWKNADDLDSDEARAYALGYQTHIATDVTGHAFVNSICGGPFRLHWQRHHLVENHMDCFWYLRDGLAPGSGPRYPQLTESALYYDIAFDEETGDVVNRPAYPTGGTMRDNWTRKRLLDVDSEMPDPLPDLLLKSMMDVWYPNGKHPKILRDNDGRPSADIIKQAYDLFFRYLKLVTVDGFSHEPPPPPDVFPNLDFPTMSDPAGDDAPGEDDGNFWDDLLDFFLSLIALLEYIAEVALYLATLPWAVLADLVTYPLRLGLYYALELPLFYLLKYFRAGLVMTGYMLPMEDEIVSFLTQIGNTTAGVFTEVLNLNGDVFGGLLPPPQTDGTDTTYRDPNYPHEIPFDEKGGKGRPSSDANEFRTPWSYPDSPTEFHESSTSVTTAGPHAAGSAPDVLFGGLTSDPALRDRFEAAGTPGEADLAGLDVTPERHLGDVVGFSQYLIWLESRNRSQTHGVKVPVVEWNLDSDFGYGYHCWDWNRPSDAPDDRKPRDPEGNPYAPPCTWPSQSDDAMANWSPDIRLQVHWVGPGLQDPGCLAPSRPLTSLAAAAAFPRAMRRKTGRPAKSGKRRRSR